jgi:hypothetical protein
MLMDKTIAKVQNETPAPKNKLNKELANNKTKQNLSTPHHTIACHRAKNLNSFTKSVSKLVT